MFQYKYLQMACLSPFEWLYYGAKCIRPKDLCVYWEKKDSATDKELKKCSRQFYHYVMPLKYLVKTILKKGSLHTAAARQAMKKLLKPWKTMISYWKCFFLVQAGPILLLKITFLCQMKKLWKFLVATFKIPLIKAF